MRAAVNVAVIALRRREPDLPRTFRVPLYPAAGLLVYLGYGRRNSRMAQVTSPDAAASAADADVVRQAV